MSISIQDIKRDLSRLSNQMRTHEQVLESDIKIFNGIIETLSSIIDGHPERVPVHTRNHLVSLIETALNMIEKKPGTRRNKLKRIHNMLGNPTIQQSVMMTSGGGAAQKRSDTPSQQKGSRLSGSPIIKKRGSKDSQEEVLDSEKQGSKRDSGSDAAWLRQVLMSQKKRIDQEEKRSKQAKDS